jgi:lipoyl(octanoyl) transferase
MPDALRLCKTALRRSAGGREEWRGGVYAGEDGGDWGPDQARAMPPVERNKVLQRSSIATPMRAAAGSPPVEWAVAPGLVDYPAAVAEMEARAAAIADGAAPERVWLVEHAPLYTAGTSARDDDLLDARFPVHRTGRGGQFTYHGPGQRIAYVMLDLKRRRPDVRAFVAALEGWLIETLAAFDVKGERREERVGVWVRRPDKAAGFDGAAAEDKIAALGIRVRRWVSFHGVALNVAPDLSHFSGIVPCGVAQAHYGVTSLRDLGLDATMNDADRALRAAFETRFGATAD